MGLVSKQFRMWVDQTTGLCCSNKQQVCAVLTPLVAWREPTGIVVLDARSGQIIRKIGIRTTEKWCLHRRSSVLAFAHMEAGDQRLLISVDNYSNHIKVYDWSARDHVPDFSEGVMVHTLRDHDRPVSSIAVSGNNSILISGSKDCRIIIWSIPFRKLTGSSYQHMGATAPSGAHRSNSVIQRLPWHVQGILKGHPQGIEAVTITFDGTRVVSGGEDGSIRMWDTNSLTYMGIISGSNPTGIFEWATCPRTNRILPKELLLSKGVDSLTISRNGSRIAGVLWK